jgi:hypothetical protein
MHNINLFDLQESEDYNFRVSDPEKLWGDDTQMRFSRYFDLNIYIIINFFPNRPEENLFLNLCLKFNKQKTLLFFGINLRDSRHQIHNKTFLIFLIVV